MTLMFTIPQESRKTTYQKMVSVFKSHDHIIFEAMANLDSSGTLAYPTSPSEFSTKHQEIVRALEFRRQDFALQFVRSVWNKVCECGGIPGIDDRQLLTTFRFYTTDKDVQICLTPDGSWSAQWSLSVQPPNSQPLNREVFLTLTDCNDAEVVPEYIAQYVNSALLCYRHKIHVTAVSLLTIAFEAMLRDVLSVNGYAFNPNTPSVDQYKDTSATITSNGTSYIVNFSEPMPKSVSDFQNQFPNNTLSIESRRVIKPRPGKLPRLDIQLLVQPELLDYWTTDQLSQSAGKSIGGLGAALDIARNRENVLLSSMLPLDFDEVLTTVRNNLVHLSRSALEVPLPIFGPNFKLADFLKNEIMVHDFVVNIADVINQQYKTLVQKVTMNS